MKLNFKEIEVVKQAVIDKILELQERSKFLNEIKNSQPKVAWVTFYNITKETESDLETYKTLLERIVNNG